MTRVKVNQAVAAMEVFLSVLHRLCEEMVELWEETTQTPGEYVNPPPSWRGNR